MVWRVDHRDLPDGPRPAERQLAAGRDVAEQQVGDRGAALACPGTRCPGSPARARPAQRRSSGRPFITSSTTGVPVATTAWSSSSCRPGSSSEDRDAASPIMFCHSPTTTTATSASRARSTAAASSAVVVEVLRVHRACCRPNMSNIDGERALGRAARRGRSRPARRRRRVARMPSSTVTVSVEVVVEDPRPDGVAPGVGQRADHRDRREAVGGPAAAGRPRCAAAPPTARPRSAPPRGAPDRPAPRGPGPRRRTGPRTAPAGSWPRAPAGRRRRASPSLTSPASTASGRWA